MFHPMQSRCHEAAHRRPGVCERLVTGCRFGVRPKSSNLQARSVDIVQNRQVRSWPKFYRSFRHESRCSVERAPLLWASRSNPTKSSRASSALQRPCSLRSPRKHAPIERSLLRCSGRHARIRPRAAEPARLYSVRVRYVLREKHAPVERSLLRCSGLWGSSRLRAAQRCGRRPVRRRVLPAIRSTRASSQRLRRRPRRDCPVASRHRPTRV